LSEEELTQYITCYEDCTLQYLEALAMNGLAIKAYTEDCDRRNFKRIIILLYNGAKIVSKCSYIEEVQQSLRIINVYIGINRKNRSWEKIEIK